MLFVQSRRLLQRPAHALEDRLQDVVGVLPRQLADVDGGGAAAHEGQPEFLGQLRVEVPHLRRRQLHRPAQVVPAGEVAGAQDQGLVHGQQELAVAGDAPLVPQGLGEGPAQADADVLHGVMVVHLGVPVAGDSQVKVAVAGEQGQHMVQEAAAGGDLGFSGAVQAQSQLNLGLFCVTLDACGTHKAPSFTLLPAGGPPRPPGPPSAPGSRW